MKSFSVSLAPADFVAQITSQLSGRELGKMVAVKLENSSTILVHFSKLGNSEIRYKVLPFANGTAGFEAKLESEKIAFAHKLFKGEMESKLGRVMEKIGVKLG